MSAGKTSCHPRCKAANPSATKDAGLQKELQHGWHQFQCRIGGHRIRSHNLMLAGVTEYATKHGGYICETVRHLHTGALGGDQIDALLTNWRVERKVLAVDLTLSNIFAATYLPGATTDAYKIIQKRAKYKNGGRATVPWHHGTVGQQGTGTGGRA